MSTDNTDNSVSLARLEDPIPPTAKVVRFSPAEHARLVSAAEAVGLTKEQYLGRRQRMDKERPDWRTTGDVV